ncbi:uncharacterized protein LOC124261642 isoform X2 [Haliotis rubra]|uniref:uncharacterized protein LOC124261642 isoform X2 n=1 Tax=Haliotis rubra TaxID=36100 RepID=UPI001EE57FF6|nr:uncharacterized protein LOC124261642 isoform X2 [Haliotis rubra]
MSRTSERGTKRKREGGDEKHRDEVHAPFTSKYSGHGTNDKDSSTSGDLHFVTYTSASTFPPTVMERGNSLEKIIESVSTKGIFPSVMFKTFEAEGKYRNLTSRLRGFISKAGRAVVGRSMAAICNLKNCDARPDTVICDALLISKSVPPTLLTFIEDNEDSNGSVSASNIEGTDDSEEERQYNKSIAKAMTYARYFTDEPFDVIYGVIRPEDTKTTKAFNRRLSTLKEETSTYSIGSNLLMSEERCLKIHKAFIMMSALSDHRPPLTEDNDRAFHFVMPVDMHHKLMLHIDSLCSGINESHRDETLNLLLNERISKTGKRTGTADDVNISEQSALEEIRQTDKGKNAKHNTMCLRSTFVSFEQIWQT